MVLHAASCRLSIIPARSVQMASIPLFILSAQQWAIVCDSFIKRTQYVYSIDVMFELEKRHNNFSIGKGIIVSIVCIVSASSSKFIKIAMCLSCAVQPKDSVLLFLVRRV